jgi:PEP-CTERM motif
LGISGSLVDPPGIISLIPTTELDLAARTEYRITLDGPTDSEITWNYNQAGAFGYTDFVSGSWHSAGNTLGAIDVIGGTFDSGPSAPEPGSALLLGLGLMAMIGIRRQC